MTLFVFFLLVAGVQAGSWVHHNSREYYIGKDSEDLDTTWHDARSFCMQSGGDLVSILDNSENDFIKGQIPNDTSFWIGFNALADRENWQWSDKSGVSFEDWKTDYPTNPSDTSSYHLCADIQTDHIEGTWKNSHCDNMRGFLCKRQSTDPKTDSPTASVGGYCPEGFYNFDQSSNKCYKMVFLDSDTGLTWQEARDHCRSQKGFLPDLVSIHSLQENSVLASQMQEYTFGLWIGLERVGSAWRWNDNSANDYTNWADGEPSSSDNHCTEMWMVPGPIGTWNDHSCDSKRGYICQTFKEAGNVVSTPASTTTNTCPSGFTPYWYGCYKLITSTHTWKDAHSECTKLSADLVSIHSATENAAIFAKIASSSGDRIWIGLNDIEGTGEYAWTDGWSVLHTEWGVDEPVENEGGGCVAMDPIDSKWYDTTCISHLQAVCKYTTATPITPPSIPDGFCPGESEGITTNWIKYNQHCYLIEEYKYLSWTEAQRQCKEDGGPLANLAAVHDLQENRFILSHITNAVWIGMYRKQSDSAFHWVDGTAVQYINWAPGEPNGEANDEDCAGLYGPGNLAGFWNDHICDNYYVNGYVCKAIQVAAPLKPSDTPGTCPDGWEAYGSDCYYFQPNAFTTWTLAQSQCKEHNQDSNLASVHHYYENEYIRERMYTLTELPDHQPYWLGLSKTGPLADGYEFTWVDGTDVDLTFWAADEPNDHQGTENCVQAFADVGTWNDQKCETYHGYICKVAKTAEGGGLSGGAIAGIVIGVLLGIVLLFGLFGFFTDRKLFKNLGNSVSGVFSKGSSVKHESFDNANYDNAQSRPSPDSSA